MSDESNQNPFSLIADFEGDIQNLFNIKLGTTLPLLPLRNMVLFPGVVIPVAIERQFSLDVIKQAKDNDSFIGVVCQTNAADDQPDINGLFRVGTVAKVMRILELPDKRMTALLQGFCRFSIIDLLQQKPVYLAEIKKIREPKFDTTEEEICTKVYAEVKKVLIGG